MKRQIKIKLPVAHGDFELIAYSEKEDENMPDLVLVHKDIDINKPVLLRIHSECITGDVFGSMRCDCGPQLDEAMRLAERDKGMVIYLRQEGRGIGILNKLKTYQLQTAGLNTYDANLHLGFQADQRQYDTALYILKDLGIQKIRLLTNNPFKINALKEAGIDVVERVPLIIPAHPKNEAYLKAKKDIMGHLLD